MLTISRIVDNDSQGTKVQLSDGSFGIIVHGHAAPSQGQEVKRKGFGYLMAVDGTMPHQTMDLGKSLAGIPEPDNSLISAAAENQSNVQPRKESADTAAAELNKETADAMDASGSNAENEDGDQPQIEAPVGDGGELSAESNR